METLVLAWGNPGRGDDGVGPAIAGRLEAAALPDVHVQAGYQLQIEDAADASRYRRVVFVDADRAGPEPFSCRRIGPTRDRLGFSSHSVSPQALLAITRDLFGAEPEAWVVGVRAYRLDELDEGLSHQAEANVERAVVFLTAALREDRLSEVQGGDQPAADGGAA